MKAPCKDCINRKLGCHMTCEKYQKFNKQREQIRQNRFNANKDNDYFIKQRVRYKK